VALEVVERDGRGHGVGGPVARSLVRAGDEAAEVAVAGPVLAQERDVMAVVERQLGPDDRADPERLRRLGELHRAVESVVVDHPDRLVTLVGRRGRQLDWVRRPVEERERRVAVELDVGYTNTCSHV
jgi:hypothetical protein